MNSAIYRCRVMHHRLHPKRHRFEHDIHMFLIDLDEIDEITRKIPFISRNRPNLYGFYDRDHQPLAGMGTARSNLNDLLEKGGNPLPDGAKVLLLTSLRMCGYVFNPVSFYFCFDSQQRPIHIIAEVGNTFKEMKTFQLSNPDANGRFRQRQVKNFYVSPFLDVDDEFYFDLRPPTDRLALCIKTFHEGECHLVSTLTGIKKDLTSGQLLVETLRIPFVTLKVTTLIHWHAILLIFKRIAIRWKHLNPGRQTDVLNPHSTLKARS